MLYTHFLFIDSRKRGLRRAVLPFLSVASDPVRQTVAERPAAGSFPSFGDLIASTTRRKRGTSRRSEPPDLQSRGSQDTHREHVPRPSQPSICAVFSAKIAGPLGRVRKRAGSAWRKLGAWEVFQNAIPSFLSRCGMTRGRGGESSSGSGSGS